MDPDTAQPGSGTEGSGTESPATDGSGTVKARRSFGLSASWIPLAILVGLAGVQSFDFNAFGILAPDIRATFHLSVPSIDTIATLTSAVPVVFSVHLGYYGDRHNRIRISAVAGVVWGLTAILTGLAPVVAVLVVARLAGGVGQLTTETIYPSLLADYYPSSDLGLTFSRYRWISQGLGLVGGPLAGFFAVAFGWRIAFVALAIPTFVFVFFLYALTEPLRGASMGYSFGDAPITSVRAGFKGVARIRALRRTWAAAFLFGAGTIPLQTLLNNFFADIYHIGDKGRGWISLLYGLGGLGGILLGGRFSNRMLYAGKVKALPVVCGALIVECGAGIVLMAASRLEALSIAATGLATVGALGFLPAYTTLVAFVTAPRLRAQAYGWSLLWYAAGAISLQIAVIGPIIDRYGQRWALVILGILVAAGGLIGASTRRFVEADMAQAFSGAQD
ncbi:MAG: MFS transporter [Acidimicrobiales bacterium]